MLLGITWGARRRPALLVGLVVTFLAATAAKASATVDITNQNDPAGDPTVISYRLTPPTGAPIDFALHDGEHKGLGPFNGQVVVQALLPAGWHVEDIQCHGFVTPGYPPTTTANVFSIDVANGRVTMQHSPNDEQFCVFKNGRIASGGGGTSTVSPSPPPNLAKGAPVPKKTALLRVRVRRGYAVATIRLIRRSVVKSALLRGGRVHRVDRSEDQAGVQEAGAQTGVPPAEGRRRGNEGQGDARLPIPGARARLDARWRPAGHPCGRSAARRAGTSEPVAVWSRWRQVGTTAAWQRPLVVGRTRRRTPGGSARSTWPASPVRCGRTRSRSRSRSP